MEQVGQPRHSTTAWHWWLTVTGMPLLVRPQTPRLVETMAWTVTMLVRPPAGMSAQLSETGQTKLVEPPMAREKAAGEQFKGSKGSVTRTLSRAALPVLVTVMV